MVTYRFYDMETERLLYAGPFESDQSATNHGDIVYGAGCYYWEEER